MPIQIDLFLIPCTQCKAFRHCMVVAMPDQEKKAGFLCQECIETTFQVFRDNWKLFIDDDAQKKGIAEWRKVPNEPYWVVATSSSKAIKMIQIIGSLPSFIDFDHDLGENDDATKVIDYMISSHFMEKIPNYKVHSRNEAGKLNIISKMESWRKAQGN